VSNLSVNTITDASGGSTASINGLTPQASNMQPFNRIINGAMTIDQRNAGAAISSLGQYTTYTTDRFKYYCDQPSKFSFQQNQGSVTPPVGFAKYAGFTSLSSYTLGASETCSLQHVIEGNNIADLNWGTADAKTITLSFWVRSSLTGTFNVSLRGGATYIFDYTITQVNTWEYKTLTAVGSTSGTWGTGTSAGITAYFTLGYGSSLVTTANTWGVSGIATSGAVNLIGTSGATFYITGVQLEAGSTASSFAHEFVGDTLQKCERYYQKVPPLVGHGNSTNFWGAVAFRTEMRVQPAISLPSNSLNWTDGYASDYPSTNANPSWTDYSAHSGGRFGTANHTAVSADARRGTMLLQTPTTLNCDAEL
jgi:hypothetical protein